MKSSAIFYLTLASVSYGIFVVLLKYLLNFGLNPLSLAASMGVFLLIFSVVYCLFKISQIKKISKINWFKIFLIGLLATFAGRILLFIGQNYTTATNAGFLVKLSALTVIPFAYFLLGEKIRKKVYFALIAMFVGTFLLVTNGKLSAINIGDLIIILLAIVVGFTNALAKQVTKDVHPNIISSLRLAIGSLFLLGVIIVLKGYETFVPLSSNLFWVFVGGVFGYIFILALYKGIELVGASKATIFFLSSALFTAIFAFIFLGEMITLLAGIGAVLILIGGFILAKEN